VSQRPSDVEARDEASPIKGLRMGIDVGSTVGKRGRCILYKREYDREKDGDAKVGRLDGVDDGGKMSDPWAVWPS
jgi:hypothetical protein